jgi:hypothetical protein
MSDNDGMDSTTRVHAVRRAWALVATSCHAQAINVTIFRDPSTNRAYLVLKVLGQIARTPRPILGRGGRWNGQTDGKILPATTIINEGKRWRGLLTGLVLFRLVAPPLQPGVVGRYLAQVVWCPAVCYWREPVVPRILGCNR